jgi:hypothetical protein
MSIAFYHKWEIGRIFFCCCAVPIFYNYDVSEKKILVKIELSIKVNIIIEGLFPNRFKEG